MAISSFVLTIEPIAEPTFLTSPDYRKWWSGTFFAATDIGFNMAFNADPIEHSFRVMSPCCRAVIWCQDKEKSRYPICASCSESFGISEKLRTRSLEFIEETDQEILAYWLEEYRLNPLFPPLMASYLDEHFRALRRDAIKSWAHLESTSVTMEEVAVLTSQYSREFEL